jgi:SAM-dependent methyltransferase
LDRKRCGSCESSELATVLDLGSSPLADDLQPPGAAPQARYPLTLQVCQRCWLAQLGCVVPGDLLYGANYGFYSGGSPALERYYAEYSRWLRGLGVLDGPTDLVVEVACNDGTLLRHLADTYRALGVDPSDGPADVAEGRGLDVIVAPFGLRLGIGIRREYGRAKVVIANNVLAHVEDLGDFLEGVRALLDDDGVLVAEVQYLPDLILGNQFDHLYHQHRSFFTVGSLAGAMAQHGLVLGSATWTPAQGGSIRVVAGPGCARDASAQRMRASEAWLRDPGAYEGLQGRADRLRDRILEAVHAQRERAGRQMVALGASAKGTTLLNWCGLDQDLIEAVHDRTPSKAGLLMPGTAIPITTDPLPEPGTTTALVLAHNYLPAILAGERDWFTKGGRFLVPVPQPVVL